MIPYAKHLFILQEVPHLLVVEPPQYRIELQGEDPHKHSKDLKIRQFAPKGANGKPLPRPPLHTLARLRFAQRCGVTAYPRQQGNPQRVKA